MDKAVDVLRTAGLASVAKKAGRATNEGAVVALVSDDAHAGALVELNCETDFVGMNEKFRAYAEKIAKAVLENAPADLDALRASEIEGETVEAVVTDAIHTLGENIQLAVSLIRFSLKALLLATFMALARSACSLTSSSAMQASQPAMRSRPMVAISQCRSQQLLRSQQLAKRSIRPSLLTRWRSTRHRLLSPASPENIQEKIATGRLEKFYKENVLTEQAYVKDPDKSVADYTAEVAKELGTTIEIVDFTRFVLGE